MQISLKQPDIIAALKLYLVDQGIKLEGKTFDTTFTAGRGGSGTTVEITINDSEIPDLGEDIPVAPTLKVVGKPEAVVVPCVQEAAAEPAGGEAIAAPEEQAEAAPAPEKKSSLFS